MKQPSDQDWDEFHDQEIVDWRRVRLAIEHENTLTNYRLMWFLTSQAFLFTAFGVVFQEFMKDGGKSVLLHVILMVLSFVGFSVAVYLGIHLHAGQVQHDVLRDWWIDKYGEKSGFKYERERTGSKRHPPICGDALGAGWVNWLTKHLPPYLFPSIFAGSWLIFFILVIKPVKPNGFSCTGLLLSLT